MLWKRAFMVLLPRNQSELKYFYSYLFIPQWFMHVSLSSAVYDSPTYDVIRYLLVKILLSNIEFAQVYRSYTTYSLHLLIRSLELLEILCFLYVSRAVFIWTRSSREECVAFLCDNLSIFNYLLYWPHLVPRFIGMLIPMAHFRNKH